MKPVNWVTVKWEPAAETFMVDFFIETAPPNYQQHHFAFGRKELQELKDILTRTLSRRAAKARRKTTQSELSKGDKDGR